MTLSINLKPQSHLQSLIKSLTWRIFATLTTIIISYLVTHRITYALSIGSIELFAKIFLYYAHERIWHLILKD